MLMWEAFSYGQKPYKVGFIISPSSTKHSFLTPPEHMLIRYHLLFCKSKLYREVIVSRDVMFQNTGSGVAGGRDENSGLPT